MAIKNKAKEFLASAKKSKNSSTSSTKAPASKNTSARSTVEERRAAGRKALWEQTRKEQEEKKRGQIKPLSLSLPEQRNLSPTASGKLFNISYDAQFIPDYFENSDYYKSLIGVPYESMTTRQKGEHLDMFWRFQAGANHMRETGLTDEYPDSDALFGMNDSVNRNISDKYLKDFLSEASEGDIRWLLGDLDTKYVDASKYGNSNYSRYVGDGLSTIRDYARNHYSSFANEEINRIGGELAKLNIQMKNASSPYDAELLSEANNALGWMETNDPISVVANSPRLREAVGFAELEQQYGNDEMAFTDELRRRVAQLAETGTVRQGMNTEAETAYQPAYDALMREMNDAVALRDGLVQTENYNRMMGESWVGSAAGRFNPEDYRVYDTQEVVANEYGDTETLYRYNAPTLAQIAEDPEAVKKAYDQAIAMGADPSKNEDILQIQQMTDEELRLYQALYAIHGEEEAQRFYDHLAPELADRVTAAYVADATAFANSNPFGAWLSTFPTKLIGELDLIADALAGREGSSQFTAITEAKRNTVTQKIAEATPGLTVNGTNVPAFLFGVITSMGDELMVRGLTGAVGGGTGMTSLIQASQIFAQTYSEAYDRTGGEVDKSWAEATAAALLAYKLEKQSWGALDADNIPATGAGKVGYWAKNVATEALEEAGEDVGGLAAQAVVEGPEAEVVEKYNYYTTNGYTPSEAVKKIAGEFGWELALDAIGGGIAGGAFAGVNLGINAVGEHVENRQVGETLSEYGDNDSSIMRGFLDLAGTLDLSRGGKKIYEELNGQYARNESLAGKNAKAQANAEQMEKAEAAEELSTENARKELTEGKNTQAQETAEEQKMAEVAEELSTESAKEELAEEKDAQARETAEERKNAEITEELDSDSAREELTGEKNDQAQEAAEERKNVEIAEELDSDSAREELAEEKNAQAQENAEQQRNAKVAKELSTENARAELAPGKGKAAVNKAKVGRLYREVMQKLEGNAQKTLRERMSFDVAKELTGKGVNGQAARDLAVAILRAQDGSATREDLEVINGNAIARDVLLAYTAKVKAADEAAGKVDELRGLLAGKPPKNSPEPAPDNVTTDEDEPLDGEDEFDAVVAEVQEQEVQESEGETSTLDGEDVEIVGLDTKADSTEPSVPMLKVKTSDGTVKSALANSVAYGTNDENVPALAAFASKYGRNGDIMYSAYQPGQNVVEYARAFSKAVQAGSDGRNLATLKNTLADVLTEQQITKAYEMGRGQRDVRGQEQQTRRSAKGANVPVGKVDTSSIRVENLKLYQKNIVDAMGKLAQVLKMNVRFVQSGVNAQGRYTAANGSWNADTRTLTLDINAGKWNKNSTYKLMMDTAGHELTHYIRQFADSKLWDEYQDFVMSHLDTKLDLEEEINQYMSGKQKLSRDDAIEEVIAQASVKTLSKITDQQLAELVESNPGLIKKIKDGLEKWIKSLKEKIREAFGSSEGESNHIAQAMMDQLDEMAAKWNAMLVNASKNANATAAQEKAPEVKAQKKAPTAVQAKTVQQDAVKQFIPYAHIDERTLDSVKEIHTKLFCSEVDVAQAAYPMAAGILMDDLNRSIAGQKFFAWNEQGDLTVTGQKRTTSEMLAHMKDTFGWTWDDIRNTLQGFIDMGNAEMGYPMVKNTIRNRRMEVYLHEMLTEGYTTIDGTKIAPGTKYVEAVADYQGSQGAGLDARIPEDAIPFEDYVYTGDDVKYQDRFAGKDKEDIYRYTRAQYNSYAWATDNGVLSPKEVSAIESINSARKHGGKSHEAVSADGFKVVEIGEVDGIHNVVAVTNTRLGAPSIERVYRINSGYETLNAEIREDIYKYERAYGKDALENVRRIYTDEIIQSYSKADYLDLYDARTGRSRRPGGSGGEMGKAAGELHNGERSTEYAGRNGAVDDSQLSDLYQERDPNQISDRELLATALQSVTQNADEWDNLRRYQNKIAALNEKQRLLEQTNDRIAELTAQDSKANQDELIRLKNAAAIYAKQIDRADGELLKYEAMKPIKKLADREREAYKQKLKAKTDEQIRRYKERVKMDTQDKIREIRERAKERADERVRKAVKDQREIDQRKVDRLKESHGKEKYRAAIMADVKKLYSWVVSPTNKGHVPQFLREPLGKFLESIDFSSASLLKGKDATKNDRKFMDALEKLRYAISDLSKQQSDIEGGANTFAGYIDLPSDYMAEFDELVRKIKTTLEIGDGMTDTAFNRMTADQLHEMSKLFRILNSSITKMNRLVANGRYESARTASNDTITDMNAMNAKVKTNKVLSTLNSMFNWKNTTPYYAFQRLGRGGKAIFEGLQDGWDKMARNSAELIAYAKEAFTAKQAKAWSKDIQTIELDSGESVQMTVSQIMSLYCLSKREQAVGHLKGGGIRVSDIDAGKGNTISQVDNYILSEADIDRITGKLTAEQQAVADKLQKFMNTTCSDWGNEISMKRFGYEMFTEKNYFPIETDANNRSRIDDKQDGNNSMFRLLNMSAMKELTPNANNAIIVRDIFDVFSNHASDIGKYNALALPILDFIKWYNFVERADVVDEHGKPTGQITTRSTQKALERAYGSDAKSYLMSFIKDLNAEHDGGRNDTVLSKLMGTAKAGSVNANIRVGFLQITSLPRAAYAINTKYLLGGMAKLKNLNPVNAVRGTAAQEDIGILKWKSLGFYSTDVARSTRGLVRRDDSTITKVRDFLMKPAEWGDNWVSNIIYEAVKLEMKDKHPALKPGTKAYDAMLNKRVREIVYKTQVVDSTMTRSDFMRSKGLMTAFTAFMSEPTLTVNMLNESIQEAVMNNRAGMSKSENLKSVGGKTVRAAAVFAFTALASALVESIFDAMRDDDDYEELEEKFAAAFTGNVVDNVNVLGMLPILKDLVSIAQGYENNSMVTQAATQIMDMKKAIEAVQKGDRPVYSAIYNALKVVASTTGVGVQNATRDGVALYNTFLADAWGMPRVQTYENSKSEAAKAYYAAMKAGDTEKAEWILERAEVNGLTEEELSGNFSSIVRNEFNAGNVDAATAERYLIDMAGKDADAAYWQVREWEYTGADEFSKYGSLKTSVASGDRNAATAAYRELVEHGTKEESVAEQLSKLYNSGEATSLLNLQMRSNQLYTSTLKLKADGQAHKDDFDAFITAIVNGSGVASEIRKLKDKGYTTKQIMSAINGAFGKTTDRYGIMQKYNSREAAILLERILDAYEALGLNRKEELAWINENWAME